MNEIEQLEQAIAALEAQRPLLGDAVVETMLASAREKLAALRSRQPADEAQRKHVTILFADVSGFTALSETLDAEDVSDLMNAMWQRLDQAITRHHGLIDKHIGDAVMALWGAGQAREDDPEQAIRAALAMQQELAAFRQESQAALSMRIGLNTGPVLLGAVATTREFTAMGDAVNLASRLEHAAPVGGILISGNTYRHVRGVFDVQALAPIQVKGKQEPVPIYQVLAARPRAFRVSTRGVEGIETHTIGREPELLALQNAYRDALEGDAVQLVTMVGDPGVGKSRLMYEFENWIDLQPTRCAYFKGRAVPETRHQPAGLLRDLFSSRFEIRETDSLETVRHKFVEGMAADMRAGLAGSIDPEMAGVVGQLCGFDFSHLPAVRTALSKLSFDDLAIESLAAYFTALATRSPVVVLLEDLHWADDRSLDLVGRLLEALASPAFINVLDGAAVADDTPALEAAPPLPLLVLGMARPALYERRPDWGAGLNSQGIQARRLDLKPLSTRDSRALVMEILQRVENLPELLRDTIVSQAEGNPFYLEELIKMLLDEGVIVRGTGTGDPWQVQMERLERLHVPPTLAGVLQARLDGLPPLERQTLQHAAVIGRQFWDAAVRYLSEEAQAARVGEALMALRMRELVYRRERSAFNEANEFLFKHALLRDVAYESVLRRTRRLLHQQAAGWLIQAGGSRVDEYAALIAAHYALAEDTRAEAEWQTRAARHAAAQYAHASALAHIRRALELLPEVVGDADVEDAAARFDLLLQRSKIYHLQARREEERLDLDALDALAGYLDDPVRKADASLQRALYHWWTGEYPAACQASQRALQAAEAAGDLSRQADIHHVYSASLSKVGDFAAARQHLEDALPKARAAGDRRMEGHILMMLAGLAFPPEDTAHRRAMLQEALALSRETGDMELEIYISFNLAGMGDIEGEFAAQREAFTRCIQVCQKVGDRVSENRAFYNLGVIAFNMGDIATAGRIASQSLQNSRALADRFYESMAQFLLGDLAMHRKDYPAAQAAYEHCLAMAGEMGHHFTELIARLDLALVQSDQARLEEASAALEQLLEPFAQTTDRPYYLACARAALADVYRKQGRLDDALPLAEQAWEFLQANHQLPTEKAAQRTYPACYRVFQAAGDLRAPAVLDLARQGIDSIAARLDDTERTTYFTGAPGVKEILSAFAS